jgi:hypothetical protein
MSVKPNTNFSKKKANGTSNAMYQRIPAIASDMEFRITGWFNVLYVTDLAAA